MGGIEILALLVGAIVGTAVVFWVQENRKRALRQAIDAAERDKEVPPPAISKPRSRQEPIASTSASLLTEPPIDISELASLSPMPGIEPLAPKANLQKQPDDLLEEPNPVTQIFDEPPLSLLNVPIPAQTTQSLKQPLSDKIAAWGQLANPRYIPQILQYANHPHPSVREAIAKALGQIATARNIHAHLPQVIPVLDSLSRDRDLETRYQAIVALSQIESDRGIPTLIAALHNPSSKLAKAASAALERLKYYVPPAIPQPFELPTKVVYKKPVR